MTKIEYDKKWKYGGQKKRIWNEMTKIVFDCLKNTWKKF